MNTILPTSTFPLPRDVRHAFYSLQSASTLSFACDIHSHCVSLVQMLLDSGQISASHYVFYVGQLVYRLEARLLSLGGSK